MREREDASGDWNRSGKKRRSERRELRNGKSVAQPRCKLTGSLDRRILLLADVTDCVSLLFDTIAWAKLSTKGSI